MEYVIHTDFFVVGEHLVNMMDNQNIKNSYEERV